MKVANFKYKCRYCEEIYTSGITSEKNGAFVLIAAILGTESPLIGMQPGMIDTHYCEKGKTGVADLVGYELSKRETDK